MPTRLSASLWAELFIKHGWALLSQAKDRAIWFQQFCWNDAGEQ